VEKRSGNIVYEIFSTGASVQTEISIRTTKRNNKAPKIRLPWLCAFTPPVVPEKIFLRVSQQVWSGGH